MSGSQNLLKLVETYFNLGDFLDVFVKSIIRLDKDNIILAIDTQGAELLGYTPGELIGKPMERLFPQWTSACGSPGGKMMLSGRTRGQDRLELNLTCKTIQTDQDPETLVFIHQNPEQIPLSLDLFGQIFDHYVNGVLLLDIEQRRFLLVNPGLEKMLGLHPEEELPDQTLTSICPARQPDGRSSAEVLTEVFTTLRTEKRAQLEFQFQAPGHPGVTTEVTLHLLPSFEKPVAVVVIRDVSHRKAYERDLMESQQTLEAVIKTAVDGIIIIDEQGIIQLVNQAVLELFGYDRHELVGENIRILMPEPHHTRHDSYLENYHRTGDAKVIGIGREVRGLRKNGTTFPFRLGVSELNLDGRKLFTGVIHDLTDQKAAEAKILRLNKELENKVEERTEKLTDVVNKLLQSNLRLEKEVKDRKSVEEALLKKEAELRRALENEKELSELKSRFVSMASHEFRTPLTTIASSTELIGLYTEAEQQEKREKHLRRIKAAVTNLTGILGDFLSLSRLEEGKIEIHPEHFLLADLCEEVVEQLQGMLKTGQKIRTKLQDCESELHLDKKMLKNIFINLLSNAIKYSQENKTILLESHREAKELVVNFIDQGIGIPEEDQKHLFSRFFRAHNAGNVQGTGLGLNIVKRYLDLMGGSISFSSKEGQGTTFTIRVPTQTEG